MSKITCPKCDGEGIMECPCCSQLTDCDQCDGYGVVSDPDTPNENPEENPE